MALVVTRRPGERIQVGDVTIRVGSIKGRSVRIAIEAPDHVRVTHPTKAEDLSDRLMYAEICARGKRGALS